MKLLKQKLSLVLVMVLTIMFLFGCGNSDSNKPQEVKEEKIILKVGCENNTEHYYYRGLEKFKQIVEQETNGTVEIQIYPSSQLGQARSVAEGVQLGTIEMTLSSTPVLGQFAQEIGVFDLPFLFPSREIAYKVLDGEPGTKAAQALEKKGIKVLAFWENGFRYITNSKKPITVPEDLKGLKIRVPESTVYVETFKTLGAAPTPMAFGEVFTALQQKTIDGQENPASTIVENRMNEVQKYLALSGHIYAAEPLAIGVKIWNEIPEKYQEVIQKAAIEARDYERKLSIDEEGNYLKKAEAGGMEISKTDYEAFRKAVEPVYQKFADKYGIQVKEINAIISAK